MGDIPQGIPESVAQMQQPLLTEFGKIGDTLREQNRKLAVILGRTEDARIAGMTTIVPIAEKNPNSSGPRLNSVTYVALFQANPESEQYAPNVPQNERDALNSLHMARITYGNYGKNGRVRTELLAESEDSVSGLRKFTWKDSDSDRPSVALTIFDRVHKEQSGVDRTIVANYWREEVAKEGLAAFNAKVAEEMGPGNAITDTELSAILTTISGKESSLKRRFEPVVLKVLSFLGRKFAERKLSD